jgi:hypothetical protein
MTSGKDFRCPSIPSFRPSPTVPPLIRFIFLLVRYMLLYVHLTLSESLSLFIVPPSLDFGKVVDVFTMLRSCKLVHPANRRKDFLSIITMSHRALPNKLASCTVPPHPTAYTCEQNAGLLYSPVRLEIERGEYKQVPRREG